MSTIDKYADALIIQQQEKRVVIVDLDGTLYDTSNRAHLVKAGQWDAFHAASVLDKPNQDVLDLVMLLATNFITILGITGRNDRYRFATTRWLKQHNVPMDDLLMRGDGDFRPDVELKTELLDAWLADNFMTRSNVWFALDDRDKVVDGWRTQGIPCYQVRPGGY